MRLRDIGRLETGGAIFNVHHGLGKCDRFYTLLENAAGNGFRVLRKLAGGENVIDQANLMRALRVNTQAREDHLARPPASDQGGQAVCPAGGGMAAQHGAGLGVGFGQG